MSARPPVLLLAAGALLLPWGAVPARAQDGPVAPASARARSDLSRWSRWLEHGVDGQPLAAGTAGAAVAPPPACGCRDCDQGDCGCGCACAELASGLPPGFHDQLVLGGLDQVTGFAFAPGGLVYLWEKGGRVRVLEPGGTLQAQPLLDLSEEIEAWNDHGLLGLALDPQFAVNGRLYLLYVVDHHHAQWFGTPQYSPAASEPKVDTIGRVTAYTVDVAGGYRSVLPGSRQVLLGESLTTGIPISGTSHGVGSLAFGDDGTLLVSVGDNAAGVASGTALAEGILTPKEDVGPWRAQLVDGLNGKVLRLDPASGDGLPSNPFWDPAAPRAPRSRVWLLGLRNPARMTQRRGSGSAFPGAGLPGLLALADVGAESVEELSLVAQGGANLGWPVWEGMDPFPAVSPLPNLDAPNPLAGQPGCSATHFTFADLLVQDSLAAPAWPNPCDPLQPITGVPTFTHHRPALDWFHDQPLAREPGWGPLGQALAVPLGDPAASVAGEPFAGNCSIAGPFYPGGHFPDAYDDVLFQADFGAGWIRALHLGPAGELLAVEPFATTVGKVVWLDVDPADGALWYLDYKANGVGNLHVIRHSDGNLPPLAAAAADPAFGPAPRDVTFSSAGSSDPEGLPLAARWDFSDGSPWSLLPEVTRNLPATDVTAGGTPILKVLTLVPPGSTGFSNPDVEVLRDGVRPPAGSLDDQLQYDTIHVVGGVSDKGLKDWFGYEFPAPLTFTGLLFQEGMNYGGGGWLDTWQVHVRSNGTWKNVPGAVSAPAYPGDPLDHFETFELRFPPVTGDAIRLYGEPGGLGDLNFVTIAELRVMARPAGVPAPELVQATLTVTDGPGLAAAASATAALGGTPPRVVVKGPLTGGTYPVDQPLLVSCLAVGHDAESPSAELTCDWQVILHHDNHTHPQPSVPGCDPDILMLAEGDCSHGDVYFQELVATVTDPLGLQASASVYLVPECDRNLNGVEDQADIASGASRDHDGDGVPDECQGDCNGNGVADFYDLYFGSSVDEDGDGWPDECDGVGFQAGALPAPAGPQPPP